MLTTEIITNQEELDTLNKLAAEDEHITVAPTHIFQKNSETVGYFSLCGIALNNLWLDSEKLNKLESYKLLKQMNDVYKKAGIEEYIIFCSNKSPFYKYMEKSGAQNLGSSTIFKLKI